MFNKDLLNQLCAPYEEQLNDLIIARDFLQTVIDKAESEHLDDTRINESKEKLEQLNNHIDIFKQKIEEVKSGVFTIQDPQK